jgi:hypothetical protein
MNLLWESSQQRKSCRLRGCSRRSAVDPGQARAMNIETKGPWLWLWLTAKRFRSCSRHWIQNSGFVQQTVVAHSFLTPKPCKPFFIWRCRVFLLLVFLIYVQCKNTNCSLNSYHTSARIALEFLHAPFVSTFSQATISLPCDFYDMIYLMYCTALLEPGDGYDTCIFHYILKIFTFVLLNASFLCTLKFTLRNNIY